MRKINAQGLQIGVMGQADEEYVSLTDMAKYKNSDATGIVIAHWMSTKYTVQFMGAWEQLHNQDFNVTEFRNIKTEAGANGFILSSSQWIRKTSAIGIRSNAGRYGGTFAHRDIAFEFATGLSPEFKFYLIKEFQRLKIEENKRLETGWDFKRMLTKINYRIHTDAIRTHLVPARLSKKQKNMVYSNKADVLSMALFGLTAKVWRERNAKAEGNIRDYADISQLVCLANLESLNAEFIRQGINQQNRLVKLNEIAIIQVTSLVDNPSIKKLKE